MLIHSGSGSSAVYHSRNTAAERYNICLHTAFGSAAHIMYMIVDQAAGNNAALRINHLTVLMVF
jgi:hypothetical protein